MRTRPVVAAATFAAITLLTIGQVGHATASRRCALITFERATWVTDTLLVGTYLIEHDDVRMAIGEACTVLYRGAKGGEVVVSFHCIPHERAVPSTFSTRVSYDRTTDTDTLLEYQFAGDSEAHSVPLLARADQ
jgi:hypothetical protein